MTPREKEKFGFGVMCGAAIMGFFSIVFAALIWGFP
jgi:hypothetical protein